MIERHNTQMFSTKDQDNDGSTSKNCAGLFFGGWWYGNPFCIYSNLNGQYGNTEGGRAPVWWKWKVADPMIYTAIMVKRK